VRPLRRELFVEAQATNTDDTVIILGCVGVLFGAAIVVHRLRPAQQLVVLAGAAALAFQALYPPCVLPDGSTSRGWPAADLSYSPGGGLYQVDVGQQVVGFSATVALMVVAYAVLEWRHRARRSP
jgi:hypothetical protein